MGRKVLLSLYRQLRSQAGSRDWSSRGTASACLAATSWSVSSARSCRQCLPKVGIVIGGGVIANIINALIGAIILLLLIRVVKSA